VLLYVNLVTTAIQLISIFIFTQSLKDFRFLLVLCLTTYLPHWVCKLLILSIKDKLLGRSNYEELGAFNSEMFKYLPILTILPFLFGYGRSKVNSFNVCNLIV